MIRRLKSHVKHALLRRLQPYGDGWLTQAEWNALYDRLYDDEAIRARRFYNIGAGNFSHFAWTNIDKRSDWYQAQQESAFKEYDLFSHDPLPAESNAEIFYASHVIEHVDNKTTAHLFSQMYRLLKPEGVVRITCPNADLAYRALMADDRDYFYWQHVYSRPEDMERAHYKTPLNKASIEQLFISHIASNASHLHVDAIEKPISDSELRDIFEACEYEKALDEICSRVDIGKQKRNPGNHMNWWNPKKIKQFLADAGFEGIYPSAYGQSACAVLRDTALFDKTHPKFSCYVEARK